jgi:hypothetical protein
VKKRIASACVAIVLLACSTGGKVGVAECDDYLEKALKCSEKGGPGEALKMSNDMLKKSWVKNAGDATQKSILPATCKAALEGAKKAYTACEW